VTTFLLVRHGAHDLLGRAIAGRAPGIGLNEQGRSQALQLVSRLQHRPIDAIYSSPRQRARETAAPLAARRELEVNVSDAFDEIDFGEWTGKSFDDLRADQPRWSEWVDHKSTARAPGGEPFADVPQRALAGLDRLAQLHEQQHVLIASHGDVIRAIIASVLRMSLDDLECFEIVPASLSIVVAQGGWRQVQLVNEIPATTA
jgi:broad specificity phosphatase PhoE